MTNSSQNRSKIGRGRRAPPAAFLILVLVTIVLPGFACCFGGGGEPPFHRSLLAEWLAEQKAEARKESFRKRIRQLERSGDSAGLLAFAKDKQTEVWAGIEAIGVVGRLGRSDDAFPLLELLDARLYFPPVAQALGEIGGPRACAALAEALRGRLKKTAARHRSFPTWDVVPAAEQSGCFTEDELTAILWEQGEEIWIREGVHTDILEILRAKGDARAAAMLARYAALLDELDGRFRAERPYTVPELREVFLDNSLPWWVKRHHMARVRFAPGNKEDLLDAYLPLAIEFFTHGLSLRGADRDLRGFGGRILYSPELGWARGTEKEFFDAVLARSRETLRPDTYRRLVVLVREIRQRAAEVLRKRREKEAFKARQEQTRGATRRGL